MQATFTSPTDKTGRYACMKELFLILMITNPLMKIFLKLLSILVLIAPIAVFAQYQPLVGIPGVGTNTQDFDAYLQAVYATSISLAALLAVIKIVIAGVKWMTTDIVSNKTDAKADIQGAILGLVVILAAVLILYIINPNIGAVSLNLTPAPQPPVVVNDPTLTPLENCVTEENCTVVPCAETLNDGPIGPGPRPESSVDCSLAETRCFGTFVEIESGTGRGRALCTATDAEIEAALVSVANSFCPEGEECFAEICRQANPDNCSSACLNPIGGVHYDLTTNACITSTTQIDDELDIVIENVILRDAIVDNSSTMTGFGNTIGASEVYYLAEVPNNTIDPDRQTITDAMEGVCNQVANREQNENIGIVVESYNNQTYVGCVR
jgi:hypothetical protein